MSGRVAVILLWALASACDRSGELPTHATGIEPTGIEDAGESVTRPGQADARTTDEDRPSTTTGLDWTDARGMAAEILNRCRGTSPDAIIDVSTRSNHRHDIERREGQSVCETIFGPGSWRTEAVQAWNGEIGAVRMQGDEARAFFHDIGDGGVAVVTLKRENDQWRFEDIDGPSRWRFESWGSPVP